MTPTKLKIFIEQVKANPELQEQLKHCSDINEVLKIAKEMGHELSTDDLIASDQLELSSADLDQIAGGCKVGEVIWSGAVFGICRLWGVANTCSKSEGC
jgi:predicted ribosomally synthesized peptide with nif11-like leader